jgi:type II secretory pathway pseudopilin PulG
MKKTDIFCQYKQRLGGFSIIELIIALLISLVVLSGVYAYFNSQHKAHVVQTRVTEMNQNIRVAMNQIVSEIRMAGFKTGYDSSFLMSNTSQWTSGLVPDKPYTVAMNDNLIITKGASDPPDDMISFIYADTDPTTLSSPANQYDSTITLSMSSADVAATFHVGDMIFIGSGIISPAGELEYAKILNISGNQLGIDCDAVTAGVQGIQRAVSGLPNSYRAGAEVGLMKVVTYAVFNETNDSSHANHREGHPVLAKICNSDDSDDYAQIAEDIESMEIQAQGEDVEITLIGRTLKPDSGYNNPIFGDHYRRRTLSSMVQIRNR